VATITGTRTIDRTGKTISTYVVFDVAEEFQHMAEGEVLELLTDDFEPLGRDIAAWCEVSGHQTLLSELVPTGRRLLIEKGPSQQKQGTLAMVVSVGGLEELLSPLAFALAAALEGMEVALYFQGPAVRVLSRGFRPRLAGWRRPFSRFAAADMAKSGHISAQDKLRQLRSLGAEFYMCGPSMQHFKVSAEQLIFDDLPLVEYLTFMPIMAGADVQLYL
jgi:predicted peroxiredoxin/TusA-related sulfurtransferase